MQPTSNKTILNVRYYQCGYCTNRLGLAYSKESFSKKIFPSGVFLIEHPTYGYLLFDTGYSCLIKRSGCLGWIYRKLNPVHITQDEEIISQLKSDNISANDINYVILSHLHPDHIGGCHSFPNAQFLLSGESFGKINQHKTSDLILDSLIPKWLPSRIKVFDEDPNSFITYNGCNGYDIFNDGSLIIINLPGHTNGHIGALIPNTLLLAGDACWNNDLVAKSSNARWIFKRFTRNYDDFLETISLLKKLRSSGIRLCFSHEFYEEKAIVNVT